jgi:putative hydrolase of the HAD superfamily
MSRFIQAVLFDLGETLVYSKDTWAPVLIQADRTLADKLFEMGIELDRDSFHGEFNKRLQEYYADRDKDLYERTTSMVLKNLLKDKGVTDAPDSVIRAALDALYGVTQQNWYPEEDAAPTLKKLQERGLRLGIVSNAGDHKDVLELVEKAQLESYFDFVITSALCSYRKPHPRIFQMALTHWGSIKPEEVAMVGDKLEADIWGAQQMGMLTFWMKRRYKKTREFSVQADYAINELLEIPSILQRIK